MQAYFGKTSPAFSERAKDAPDETLVQKFAMRGLSRDVRGPGSDDLDVASDDEIVALILAAISRCKSNTQARELMRIAQVIANKRLVGGQ